MDCPVISILPYQRAAIVSRSRFTWNCWARQTGKSFTLSLRRILRGIRRRRNQIIFSAGERQSRELMDKVRMHCAALRIWCDAAEPAGWEATAARRLEARLPGNIRILALPANPMTARGFTGDVLLDEFAMHRDDAAVWSALFPSILRGGGELDVASTPRGRSNLFYRLRDNALFEHCTVTLADAVATGLAVDVAALRAGMHDDVAWRQEFECEFVDEATAFLTYDLIAACQEESLSTAVNWERLRDRQVEAFVGVDVGRRKDVTVIWVWERLRSAGTIAGLNTDAPLSSGRDTQSSPTADFDRIDSAVRTQYGSIESDYVTRGIVVLEAAPFAEQESEISRILALRGVRRCCIDATGLGLQLAERMAARFGEHRVEGVMFTAALKSVLAGSLRVAAEQGRLRIPIDDAIVRDWHSLNRIVTSGGHVRFDADRAGGGHADMFWAAALGIHAADACPTGDAGLVTTGPLTFGRSGIW